MKKFATALSLAALLTVPAIAQETTAPKIDAAAATVEKTTNYSGQISASELLNENVVIDANEKVGDINDILIRQQRGHIGRTTPSLPTGPRLGLMVRGDVADAKGAGPNLP